MLKISIIIPVYNVEPYLVRALDSVCNQTLKEIEIICINDCSTDNSLSILEEYAKNDDRIKVINFTKNKGAAVARNTGLKEATGEYLGFIDPDDYIDLNYYEELYNKAIEDNADIVKCPRKNIDLNGVCTIGPLHQRLLNEKNKFKFTYEWTTAIYKTKIIFENDIIFPEECLKGQDDVFLNRFILKIDKLSLIDNVFYYYVRRENSLNANKLSINKLKSALKAFQLILDNIENSDLSNTNTQQYVQLYATNLSSIITFSFKNNEYKAKYTTAEILISCFNNCKYPKELEQEFKFPFLLTDIKKNNIESIAKKLFKYKSLTKLLIKEQLLAFEKDYKLSEKIFSIKNKTLNNASIYRIISILGIKIRTRNRKKEIEKSLKSIQWYVETCLSEVRELKTYIESVKDLQKEKQ